MTGFAKDSYTWGAKCEGVGALSLKSTSLKTAVSMRLICGGRVSGKEA